MQSNFNIDGNRDGKKFGSEYMGLDKFNPFLTLLY